MTKLEVLEKKLEYLDDVIKRCEYDDDDDSKEETEKRYLNALNSEIAVHDKIEKDELEIEKKKLEIEKIKAESNEKKKLSISESVLEWAKVLVPVVIPMLAYGVYQKRMLNFEETGSIRSKTGKEMHLPNYMK